jgi:hypothetical protein
MCGDDYSCFEEDGHPWGGDWGEGSGGRRCPSTVPLLDMPAVPRMPQRHGLRYIFGRALLAPVLEADAHRAGVTQGTGPGRRLLVSPGPTAALPDARQRG